MRKYYLLVSDFDQTLSFNDSGLVLAEMLGIPDFQERVANLSRLNLVQAGAELTYLLRHDPEFRRVRQEERSHRRRSSGAHRGLIGLHYLVEHGVPRRFESAPTRLFAHPPGRVGGRQSASSRRDGHQPAHGSVR